LVSPRPALRQQVARVVDLNRRIAESPMKRRNLVLMKLLKTTDDYALTLARLVLGIVFFAHGAQKALGWFGGYGFTATMQLFTQKMGLPASVAFLAIMAEFLGSLGLIFGALTRIAAFGIFCVMLVAVLMVHLSSGLFMNWAGTQKGEGFEYHLLAMALAAVLMLRGAGPMSVDHALSHQAES
jgi:putative oxidoreductase